MFIIIAIVVASMFVALNGLLYQPKKDSTKPVSWQNINLVGKILFGLVILLAILATTKSIYDEGNYEKEIKSRNDRITGLIESQRELKEINNHLIKVMSVADGYNAIIRGVITFKQSVDDTQIRNALKNLFLKYAEVDLKAENKLGEYRGRIDYAAHPEVRKFLHLSNLEPDSYFSRYQNYSNHRSYYFEIRCSRIKILNPDNIQYARFSPDEDLHVRVNTFEWSRDFGRLYYVEKIMIDEIEIEELEKITLQKTLQF